MSQPVESDASGVLVSGLYGAGKSTVVEEIAGLLEDAGSPYGALDLDWLWWFHVPSLERPEALKVLYDNLASVTDAYLDVGITRFVMAWSPRDPGDLGGLRASVSFPVTVAELTVPLPVIEARLGAAPSRSRQDDMREARRWHREGLGVGLGDVQIAGDRPVRTVAHDVLDWLGWQ
jgi:hypothetical protein